MTDRRFYLTHAPRQATTIWPDSREVSWLELVEWLGLSSPALMKDCGCYVLGRLRGNRRLKASVQSRSCLTLDADHATPTFLLDAQLTLGTSLVAYSTFSHTSAHPRYRLIVPLDRDITAQEYRALAKAVMEALGVEQFDRGSSEPERLMHLPSSADRQAYQTLAVLDEGWLAVNDWLDAPSVEEDDDTHTAESNEAQRAQVVTYVSGKVEAWRTTLMTALDLSEGARDHKDRGWEALSYQCAWAMACLAVTPWTEVDGLRAQGFYDSVVPPEIMAAVGSKWNNNLLEKAAAEAVLDDPPWLDFGDEEPGIPRHLDDARLSEWLARRGLRDTWCWAGGLGWRHWDGKRWAGARDEDVVEAIRQEVVRINRVAWERGVSRDRVKALFALQSASKIGALARLMRGVVAVDAAAFDANPNVLNVGNGVIDLRTGLLGPHDPTLRLTRVTKTRFMPGARHEDWEQVLKCLDPEVADWMQVRFGQGVTGWPTSDHILPIGQGSGSNGKTTLLAGLYRALGEHMVQIPAKLLSVGLNDHPTELMTLHGARVAVIDETPEAAHLNVARLKAVLGSTHVTARSVFKDNVSWKATHSVFVMTNYTPQVNETDHGTWRRLALVRFDRTFVKDEMFLTRILSAGPSLRSAVLAWVVEGSRRWYAAGRVIPEPPEKVVKDTRNWRTTSDLIMGYTDERLMFDPDACLTVSDLLEDFNEWSRSRGQRPWSERLLSSRFSEHQETTGHGVVKRLVRNPAGLVPRFGAPPPSIRCWVWAGVRWRTEGDV